MKNENFTKNTSNYKIIRLREAYEIFGLSRASFYKRMKDGVFPPSINLGGRAVGWLESEILAVLQAVIKGKTKLELQTLVNELVDKRKKLVL